MGMVTILAIEKLLKQKQKTVVYTQFVPIKKTPETVIKSNNVKRDRKEAEAQEEVEKEMTM